MNRQKRLASLADNSKSYIVLTVLTNWICLVCNIAVVSIFAMLLGNAAAGESTAISLACAFQIVAACISMRFLCGWLSTIFSHKAASGAKREIRAKLYDKLLRLGTGYTEKVSTAQVVQVAMEGVEQLQVYFGGYLPQLYYSILAPLTLFIYLSMFSYKTALVLLLCLPVIPICMIGIQRYAKKLTGEYWNQYTDLGSIFLENLQGLTTLKIFAADQRKQNEMAETAERFRRITMRVLRMQLNSVTVMDLVAYGGTAAGIVAAIFQVRAGTLGLGEGICIVLISAEFFLPLRLLGSFFHISMNSIAAGEKIFSILNLPEEEDGTLEMSEADIELKALSFRYGAERKVLKDITFKIPHGTFAALIGDSGSGKSTLAAVLSGLKPGYGGSVLVGEREIKDIKQTHLMKNIMVVDHNAQLFRGTLKENLTMGKPDATDKELYEVLKKVNLYDFALAQGGLAMEIKEQGSNLSGGQRQRLSLARALLHDSSIYIFDEATSNIDRESEAQIMEVISELKVHKTVLLITHRLSAVKEVDLILLMKDGSLEATGCHEELYRDNPRYAELYDGQQQIESITKGDCII